MKILVAPLNWGLGHASRCIPIINRLLTEGNEVVLGGDGASLVLLQQHFPTLPLLTLPALDLRYNRGNQQVTAMLRALPKILSWARREHLLLSAIQAEEHFDMIISDNRFGLYCAETRCIYITHQLHILFPRFFKWLEPLAEAMHATIAKHYAEVWVPDYEDVSQALAPALSHPTSNRYNRISIRYIGPLSRFNKVNILPNSTYDVVAILSGLEPQRTLFEEDIKKKYSKLEEKVLLIRGRVSEPARFTENGNITSIAHLNDTALVPYLLGAQTIIARSGYSTIMDLSALGLLSRAQLYATPGQPEQEYLEKRFSV